MKNLTLIKSFLIVSILLFSFKDENSESQYPEYQTNSYENLESLFNEWRAFEKPPLLMGAPDYTEETFKKRHPEFIRLQGTLQAIDTANWPIEQKVDWMIVWAEMNGYDFNERILKPWARDPAFYKSVWTYQSDVPAHEGPTHHMTTELWTYTFPLSKEERSRLVQDLSVIPALNEQAMKNLTGNARDLWIAGISDIDRQSVDLERLLEREGIGEDSELVALINDCIASSRALATWLRSESGSKNGPSGIGRENYTWYLQHVHLVPLSWEDEEMILKRELARAWASLKLEEHRNRNLPLLEDADTPEAFEIQSEESVRSLIEFLQDKDIVTVKDYFEPALRAQTGSFHGGFQFILFKFANIIGSMSHGRDIIIVSLGRTLLALIPVLSPRIVKIGLPLRKG